MSGHTRRFRPSQNEIDRRYGNVRAAMEAAGLDALVRTEPSFNAPESISCIVMPTS